MFNSFPLPYLLRRTLVVAVIAILQLSSSTALAATTYYLAPSGNDNNDGSQGSPWASLTKAAGVVRAGDTVVVRGGTYYTNALVLMQSGTPGAPITFRAALDEKVILDGERSSDAQGDVFSLLGDHLDIEGFEIRNAKRIGINVWGGKHISIRNNRVTTSFWNGIYIGNDAKDIEITGNVLHGNVESARLNGKTSWRGALGLNNSSEVRILNNHIFENYGEGIDAYLMRNVHVGGNDLHDNFAAQLYLDNVEGAVAEQNFIHTNYNPEFFRPLYGNNGPSAGIELANESTLQPHLSKVVIRNNMVLGGVYQFLYWKGVGQGMKDVLVVNNTFVKGGGLSNGPLHIDEDPLSVNVRFANNIFFAKTSSLVEEWNIPSQLQGITFDHDTWYSGSKPQRLEGPGDTTEDPSFLNPLGSKPEDLRLKSTSPAIDRGISLDVTEDYAGLARPKGRGIDQGAHEYSSERPVQTPPPSTPTPAVANTLLPEQCTVRYTANPGRRRGSFRVVLEAEAATPFRHWKMQWISQGKEKVTRASARYRRVNRDNTSKGSFSTATHQVTVSLSGRGRLPLRWHRFQLNGKACRL